MNRRRLLASAGLALTSPLAGCLGGDEPSPGIGTVETPPDGPFPCRSPGVEGVDAISDDGPDARKRVIDEWRRNDVPPYPIRGPSSDGSDTDWNPDYLGERMPTTPSLEFEQHTFGIREDESDGYVPVEESWTYVVDLVTAEDRTTVLDVERLDSRIRQRLADIDYVASIVVLFVDCCGMESSRHRWARVESTASGVHLHGYHTRAGGGQLIPHTRYSVLEIERPDTAVEHACVSYTVQEPTRLHVASTDGRITFVPAVLANDTGEDVEVELRIQTTTGEQRADSIFTAFAERKWNGIGVIGLLEEAVTVDLTIPALGVETSATYDGEFALGIRLTEAGEVLVGPSNELY